MNGTSFTRRHGSTLVEVLVAFNLLLLVLFGAASLCRVGNLLYHRINAESGCTETTSRALIRLGAVLYTALRVEMSQSTSSRLVVVLPRTDSTGSYIVPLEDGPVVTIYLGDDSGTPSDTGTILWRAVGGVPDRDWSLRGSRPVVALSPGGLCFRYPAVTTPTGVQVSVTATRWNGSQTCFATSTSEFFFRNAR